MKQISNPKRSVIAIPGVRKRLREENYLPELEELCGSTVEPFKLDERPYGIGSHFIQNTSSHSGGESTATNSSSSTVGRAAKATSSNLSRVMSIENGNSNPYMPSTSAAASTTAPLWPIKTVCVRYHCDLVDRSWLAQYNGCVSTKKEGSSGGGKVGGKTGLISSIHGLVGSKESEDSAGDGGPNSISSLCLEDAFTLLELHYRYVGYAPPAANLSIRSILNNATGIDTTSVCGSSASLTKQNSSETHSINGRNSSGRVGHSRANKKQHSSTPSPIYGVPTYRLHVASDTALHALKTYWVIKRTAAGLHNDGLVAEDNLPAATPTSGKAAGGTRALPTSASAASQQATGKTSFSAADSIPPFRRSLIIELCRDEQLASPHAPITATMAAATTTTTITGTSRSSGGISASGGLIFATDVLTSGDEQNAFGDYNVPFMHRTWDCPVIVQQPSEGSTQSTENSASEMRKELEQFATTTAKLVEELRRRELLAHDALQLHCGQLALIRNEANEHLLFALGTATDYAVRYGLNTVASEVSVARSLLLPPPTDIMHAIADEESYTA